MKAGQLRSGAARFGCVLIAVALSARLDSKSVAGKVPLTVPTLQIPSYQPARYVRATSVTRDPFQSPRTFTRSHDTLSEDAGVPILPANDGASEGDLPAIPSAAESSDKEAKFTLLGISSGAKSFALLDGASGVRIVSPGDVVGLQRVTAIDETGIYFSDGTSSKMPQGL